MPPRVRLGRTHGRSNTPRHEIQAGADLSPRPPALRRSHKFTALTEFCKRLNCMDFRLLPHVETPDTAPQFEARSTIRPVRPFPGIANSLSSEPGKCYVLLLIRHWCQ